MLDSQNLPGEIRLDRGGDALGLRRLPLRTSNTSSSPILPARLELSAMLLSDTPALRSAVAERVPNA